MNHRYLAVAFADAILDLARDWEFSVTSWGRTPERSVKVGGFHNDPHTLWLAVDVILDDPTTQADFLNDVRNASLTPIVEKDHIHIEASEKAS